VQFEIHRSPLSASANFIEAEFCERRRRAPRLEVKSSYETAIDTTSKFLIQFYLETLDFMLIAEVPLHAKDYLMNQATAIIDRVSRFS